MTRIILGILVLAAGIMPVSSYARDQIWAVGSSTVFPFTTLVAENFGKGGQHKTPLVESTGTGGGFKMFCSGIGEKSPDIASASRKIKDSELADCKANGVADIAEFKIGLDGIVMAYAISGAPLDLKPEHIFLAVAKKVPVNGKLTDNPYQTWKQVDAKLPDMSIELYGPSPTHGTRDAFVDLVMKKACASFPEYKKEAKDEKALEALCGTVREDGKFIEVSGNYNVIVQKLVANPKAVGVIGYSFLEENASKIKAAKVSGIEPTYDHIASGKYPLSRPLFIYAKKAHSGQIPGFKEFLKELASDRALGDDGYLALRGLIPPTQAEREADKKLAESL